MQSTNIENIVVKKCEKNISETRESFGEPRRIQRPSTLSRRLEQFVWAETYDEYLRQKKVDNKVIYETPTTEYRAEYTKEMETGKDPSMIEREFRYPLYGTGAITYHNPNGESWINKRRKPFRENEQFG